MTSWIKLIKINMIAVVNQRLIVSKEVRLFTRPIKIKISQRKVDYLVTSKHWNCNVQNKWIFWNNWSLATAKKYVIDTWIVVY